MNLWRIAVDQESGRPGGAAEPVTAGVQASAGSRGFPGTERASSSDPAWPRSIQPPSPSIRQSLRAGTPTMLDTRHSFRIPTDVSPDGKQIAYSSLGENQEDIFIGAPAGSMRRVTDDAGRDRAPMFTPDGRSLIFYSNRDGNWAVWMVAIDGANLHKILGTPNGATYPQISPEGEAVVYNRSRPPTSQCGFRSARHAGPLPDDAPWHGWRRKVSERHAWAPDGSRLAGYLMSATGRPSGVGSLRAETRR